MPTERAHQTPVHAGIYAKEHAMDEQAKKKALRMIPYGLFLLTAKNGEDVSCATVNWLTQTSFKPPLVAVAIKKDSHPYETVKAAGHFAINVLGASQKDVAVEFFGTVKPEGNKLGSVTFRPGATGAPIIDQTPAYWECKVVQVIEQGDHHIFLGEVVEAGINHDENPLLLKDTGFNYGG
jgi:flavin reductase (DIM6/NTAB) family NADH-FMN oxidoreductase RutF